jgi:hypothetical protein
LPAAPNGLLAAFLCPNPFDTTPSNNDAAWNAAAGFTPWWQDPYPSNKCDDLFTDRFDD